MDADPTAEPTVEEAPAEHAGGERVSGDQPSAELTIDQLAAVSTMTVRNIRAHQSRGLLPPPRIEGRVGYYGPRHVRRLALIRRLQDEGLNLAAIAKVVSDGRLTAAVADPFHEDDVELADPDDLLARLRIDPDDPAIVRALTDGVISIEGDRVRVESPRLLAAAEELAALGVPLDAQLDAIEVVRRASQQVAEAFVALAEEHLVARLAVDAADPDRLTPAIQRLRVAAAGVLDAQFNRAMAAAIRASFETATLDDGNTGEDGSTV